MARAIAHNAVSPCSDRRFPIGERIVNRTTWIICVLAELPGTAGRQFGQRSALRQPRAGRLTSVVRGDWALLVASIGVTSGGALDGA